MIPWRIDEPLRQRALVHLGPFGDALAREMLETGCLDVEHDVLDWEGSHGHVSGHRVTALVPAVLYERITTGAGSSAHVTIDALTAAIAAAIAERGGQSLCDFRLEAETEPAPRGPRGGPYREPG